MATIQGIQFENDANGKPIAIKINLEKYGTQPEPFFKQIGIVNEKDDFESEMEKGYTSEEARKISKEKIKSWWNK